MSEQVPLLVGLTGSIGMGKSTTAKMFAARGVPVWDADAAVARAYSEGGSAVGPFSKTFPEAVENGKVSKEALRRLIATDPEILTSIEKIVHPLLQKDRQDFVEKEADEPILLFDIPLLFETKADEWLDVTIVVSTSAENQRDRVLARPGMSEGRFQHLLNAQLPDGEKRLNADFVISTDTLEGAEKAVDDVLKELRGRQKNA